MSQASAQKLLIIGCGRLGAMLSSIAHPLYECYGIRRNLESLPAFIRGMHADVRNQESMRKALANQHFDYIVLTLTAGTYTEDAYQAVYERALEQMGTLLVGCQPKRIFFVSSSRVYGENDGAWLDEQSIATPRDFAGESILKAEALLASSKVPLTVLRPSGIYGPGHKGLISRVKAGHIHAPHSSIYTNRIHIEDVAGFIAHLLNMDQTHTPNPLYIVSDNSPTPYSDVIHWLATKMDVQLVSGDRERSARSSSRERYNRRLNNTLMLSSGYVLRYPDYRSGYAALLDAS